MVSRYSNAAQSERSISMRALWLVLLTLLTLHAPYTNASDQQTLKILTLNTWLLRIFGVPIGKDIPTRARLIPRAVANTGADLITFQEAWSNRYKRRFRRELKKLGYPYSYFVPRRLGMGDGLEIISKYPIRTIEAAPLFLDITRIEEVPVGKRALYAEIEIRPDLKIDFFSFHAGALTYLDRQGTYDRREKARQRGQYQQFKRWFQETRRNPISIVAGDFNASSLTLSGGKFLPNYADDYLELLDQACGKDENFTNTFSAANKTDEHTAEEPTYDKKNPYVAGGLFSNAPSETEDYIFSCGIAPDDILHSQVLFKEAPLLSDHYGVLSEIRLPIE